MEDGDTVDVAVVGRFKAGKSSFLNSIIGRDIIPVAVLPVTAIVTRLRYGSRDRAVVRRQDGGEHEVSLTSLAEYVTEQQNAGNAKAVAIVDVELAVLRPYRGIRLVDTPGLGSVYAHNTRTSMEWMPRVGAAMLAVSIDQPLSEYDIDLLRELAKHTPEISILLTKADLVSEKELADVTEFICEQVGKAMDGQVQVLAYSVRPGYERLREKAHGYLLQHVSARHEEKFAGDHPLQAPWRSWTDPADTCGWRCRRPAPPRTPASNSSGNSSRSVATSRPCEMKSNC